jgi:hypothetical protein
MIRALPQCRLNRILDEPFYNTISIMTHNSFAIYRKGLRVSDETYIFEWRQFV